MTALIRALIPLAGLLLVACGGSAPQKTTPAGDDPAFATTLERLFSELRFHPGTVELTEESRKALDAHGAALAGAPDWRLKLSGLDRGDGFGGAGLGERRARTLHELLLELGVAAVQVEVLPPNAAPIGGTDERRAAQLSDPNHPLIGFRLDRVGFGPD